MKSSVIRLLGRFAKFFLLIFVVNMVFAKSIAQGTDYEKELAVFKSIVESNGDEWMCYWQMNVWDRPPYLADAKVVPGLSGYSDIEIDKSESTRIYTRIKSFIDGYDLRYEIGYSGSDLKAADMTSIVITDMSNVLKRKGYMQRASANSQEINDSRFRIPVSNDNPQNVKINYAPNEIYSPDENTLCMNWINNNVGFVISKNWAKDYGNFKSDTQFVYFHSLEIQITRKINTVYAELSTSEGMYSYPVKYNIQQSVDGSTILSINNLYNKGHERYGNVFDYTFTNAETTESSVILKIKDGDQVVFDNDQLGMLRAEPIYPQTYSNNYLTANIAMNSLNYEMGYTDYLILSEDEFEKFQHVVGSQKETEIKSFLDEINKMNLEHPKGHCLIEKNENQNSHWDQGDYSNTMLINFDSHYLVPIKYFYNGFEAPYPENYVMVSNLMQVVEPIHVESLSFKVPMPVEEFSFKLSNFGHNRLSDRDNQDYLYFEGELTPARSDIQFYVVKGSIEEYSANDLNDSEKGHTEGLLLDEKYVYNNSASKPEPHVLSANNTSQKFAYLVPVSDITSDPDAQTFTLYAKYTDYAGNSRFRVLDTVDNTRITTSAKEINKDVKPAFGINGNVVTADGDVTIFDSLGKKIYELAPHESIKLSSGIYFIHSHFTGETHKIIVK